MAERKPRSRLRRIVLFLAFGFAAILLLLGGFVFYNRTLFAYPDLIPGTLIRLRNDRIQNGPLTYWWGDLVRTIEVVGNTAYVGLGTRLGVFDVSNPRQPKEIMTVSLRGIVHGFTLKGTTLYCAHGASGMSAFDVSDPANPVRLGQVTFPGYGMHVAPLQEHFVLFSNEAGGWYVLDVRDPSNMLPIWHESGGWISAARVFGNVAYILDGYAGLVIYDVSTPSKPVRLTTVPIQLPKRDFVIDPPPIWLELQDGYAYVSNGSDGMRIIDVRDPAQARAVAHLPLESYSYTVAVHGNRAYMANLSLGLVVIDISNPLAPKVLRTVPSPGNAFDIIVREGIGYLSDGASGFMLLDFSDPDSPRELGYHRVQARTRGVALQGDRLVTADAGHGLRVFDARTRQTPRLLGRVDTRGLAREAVIAGDRIYAVDVLGGFQEIDASQPDRPRLTRTFALEEHPWGISRGGDNLYCAMGSHGFSVYDARSDPPKHLYNTYDRGVTEIPTPRPEGAPPLPDDAALPARAAADGYTVESANTGKYAFSGDLMLGLTIYDVTVPDKVVQLGRYAVDLTNLGHLWRRAGATTVVGIFAEGQRAYLAGYERGLEIINLADPTKPVREGHVPVSGHSYGVWKHSNRVCLTTFEGDFFLIDVTDPSRPQTMKQLSLPGQLQDVVCEDEVAYVAAGTEGLLVVNLATGQHERVAIE